MPVIHLVHGFNVSDGGANTVARLEPYFESREFSVQHFQYGWVGLMGAFFLNPRIVKQLKSRVGSNDIGCGHSNGCTLLHRAANLGAPFTGLVFINPALRPNTTFARHLKFIDVYFNDGDHVVKLAAFCRLLAPLAPLGDPLWGDMGARGATTGATRPNSYEPQGRISRLFFVINDAVLSRTWLLWALRMTIGLSFSLIYLLLFAPIEVLATIYHNNVCAKCAEMKLTISRSEDAKFVFFGFAIPALVWTLVVLWLV
jgi:hypothetical protein